MGLWGDRILPHVINTACGSKDIRPLRERACAGLTGTVLELGFGSGLNCELYPDAVTSVLAIEPADSAWKMAAKRRSVTSALISRAGLDGQRLDLADASVDSALITFTLCTIPDVETALQEVARVVKPGGSVHIAEHGRSPDRAVARWQRRLDPAQQRLFGGCHLTRDPIRLLESAGFTDVDIDTSYVSELAAMRPWMYGYAGTAKVSAA
ncbi:MAG TPA: class I SAM-dependent methyltransferase [Aeromicrobium sp.]|nr:class I SAM-dependent methyltransferase [Aeromicrobium sp.]